MSKTRTVTVASAAVAGITLLERAALRRWAATPDPRGEGTATLPDADLEVVVSDGARLRIVEWGDRADPPVLLAHGVTATLEDWLPVVPHLLRAGRRVVAVDLRGHGRSTLGNDGVSTARLAADLAEVLAARDLRGAAVAGHSIGGYAALALAVHQPAVVAARVARLVVLDSSPTMRGPRELVTLAQNATPLMKFVQLHPRHGAVLMRLNMFGNTPALPAVQDLRSRWSGCSLRTRVAYARGLAGQSLTPRLAEVSVPVTIVRGSRDIVAPPQRSRLLERRLPSAEKIVLKGAGHVTATERPREVARIITGQPITP